MDGREVVVGKVDRLPDRRTLEAFHDGLQALHRGVVEVLDRDVEYVSDLGDGGIDGLLRGDASRIRCQRAPPLRLSGGYSP